MSVVKEAVAAAFAALRSQKGHKLVGALLMLVVSAVAEQFGVHLPW